MMPAIGVRGAGASVADVLKAVGITSDKSAEKTEFVMRLVAPLAVGSVAGMVDSAAKGAAPAAEALVSRALSPADIGLSGKGISELTGAVVDAGGTRILKIDMIRSTATAGGASIPTGEIKNAIPAMINQARSAGARVLQLDAAFAKERLQAFVFDQATKHGGQVASVGGRDIITFVLGTP